MDPPNALSELDVDDGRGVGDIERGRGVGDIERGLGISGVERETGLSKDVLRMWERRYGFPQPVRDGNGERLYTPAQMAKLRAIKRLMDVGMRPGRIVGLSLAELNALADTHAPKRSEAAPPAIERDVLALVRAADVGGLRDALATALLRQGLQRFALETIGPLNHAIGAAWIRGELDVHEEHLYSEEAQSVLRAALHALPRHRSGPRIVLATLAGESHGLGLLVAEAALASEGAYCVSLGTQVPLDEIRRAAAAHRSDVVALSFSSAFPLRQAADALATLRRRLPPGVALWAGGEALSRIRTPLTGVFLAVDPAAAVAALRALRARGGTAGAAT
ncbi:MAG: MerR family transcriptional regulator [Proteobacteria bacterium]|nr:MerR family transcriptional regulator [Pseudomonadota bacterium]